MSAVKRLSIQALVLCAMLMVVTGTAFAVGGTVSNLSTKQDAKAAVKPLNEAGQVIDAAEDGTFAGARKFQITLEQTRQGEIYTPILIRAGADVPTQDSLYWADYQEGNGGSLTFTVNSAKLMSDGAYEVWLSSESEDVKKGLVSFDYAGIFGDAQEFVVGDATLDDNVDIKDVNAVIGHITKNKLLTGTALQAADVVKDGTDDITVDIKDANKLIGYVTKNITSLTD